MAWNHNSYEKPNAWEDSKVYKADRLLEDLQIYRIITGQVNSEDYASILEKMGWDQTKLSKLTDDEKMGYIAKVLNQEREVNEYYATSSSKKRKHHENDEAKPAIEEMRKIRALEKNRKLQLEKKELKKEVQEMQSSASSNPLVLEFPAPNSTAPIATTDYSSIFHRPLETVKPEGIALPQQQQEEEKNEESEAESDVIQYSKDAPLAPILGPFCCICGKYGQYICDMTDEDVCSIECKKKAENRYCEEHQEEVETTILKEEDIVEVCQSGNPEYMPRKRRYKENVTILDSHKCPLCGKTGHLPQDCHLASGKFINVDDFERGENSDTSQHYLKGDQLSQAERMELSRLYRKCKAVRENPLSCCCECKCRSNLVYCIHCNNCYCDKYHLLHHLQHFPTHTQLYSFKLRKLIKCSNPNCNNTNIYKLYLCNKCGTTMHDKYYNMKTACWKREALCQIPNLICCEEHSTWHIMNCDGPQGLVPIVDVECIKNGYYFKEGIVNDMLF